MSYQFTEMFALTTSHLNLDQFGLGKTLFLYHHVKPFLHTLSQNCDDTVLTAVIYC